MVGAMWKATVLVAIFMFSPGGDGLFHSLYKKVRVSVPHKGDVGDPLFLTPYIEAGKLEEGKFHKIRNPLVYFQQVFFFLKQLSYSIQNHSGYFCLVVFISNINDLMSYIIRVLS